MNLPFISSGVDNPPDANQPALPSVAREIEGSTPIVFWVFEAPQWVIGFPFQLISKGD